jgi:hypothetical protein
MSNNDKFLAEFGFVPAPVRAEEQVRTQPRARHIKRTDAAAKRPVVIPQRWINTLVYGKEPSAAVCRTAIWILEQYHHQNRASVCLPAKAMKEKLGFSRRTGSVVLARLAELDMIAPQPSPGRPTTYTVIL